MKLFQGRIQGTASAGTGTPPPQGLLAFYWHFVRQTKGWYAAMFVASLAVALLDTVIPLFIGRLVSLMEATDRMAALEQRVADARRHGGARAGRAAARAPDRHRDPPQRARARRDQLIRWQSHWHVVRQSWPFFQNDFAGRIANRVMQTGDALRESAMSSIRAVWYIGVYGVSGVRADGVGRLAARRADAASGSLGYVVVPALLRAAHARPRARQLGSALAS